MGTQPFRILTLDTSTGRYNPREHGISVSTLRDWMACREAARLRLSGIKPRKQAFALTNGIVTHNVLQTAHQAMSAGKIKSVPSKAQVRGWIDAAEASWRKANPRASSESLNDLELSLLFAEAVLPEYFAFWEKDFKGKRWINVETFFRVPFVMQDGMSLSFIGYRDAAYLTGTGKRESLWLLETKTKSRINEGNLVDMLPMDLQTKSYLVALWRDTKKVPAGSTHNVIRRPQLKQGKKESIKAFGTRCAEDVKKRPEFYFLRLDCRFSKDEIEQAERELASLMGEFYAWWSGRSAHFKNADHCENKYGACSYLALCGRGDKHLYTFPDRR